MSLPYNPFPLIFTCGDEPVKLACLKFFGLGDRPKAEKILSKLIEKQRSDGAFPYRTDSDNWGIVETVRNTLHLLKAGLNPDDKVIENAVEFILRKQRPDGGWSENKAFQIPEDQVEISNRQPVTWLTADTVELLHQVDKGKERECKKAIKWLRNMQNEHGGWHCFESSIGDTLNSRGDPDSTAQITFLMGELFGKDDPVYLKGKKLFENYLNETAQDVKRGYWVRLRDGKKEKLDPYHLTHLFLSWTLDPPRRFQSGYDISDSCVKEVMNALIDIQNSDGGWRPFWSEESSPTYTFIAVKVLILSKMLSKENLKSRLIAKLT